METWQATPTSTDAERPADMPLFEAPTPFGSEPAGPPPGWVEPALTGVPARPRQPMNAWSEWSLGLAGLSLFGLILGLVVLPRSFDAGAAGQADTWMPLVVLFWTGVWVMGFGLVGLALAAVGAWRARQQDPYGPLSESAIVPLLVTGLPLVLVLTFLAALTAG